MPKCKCDLDKATWETYKKVSRTPVSYSHLLHRKRNFQKSVSTLKANESGEKDFWKRSKLSSCAFIAQSTELAANNLNMKMILLDEQVDKTVLLSNIFIHRTTVIKTYNQLCVFLHSKTNLMIELNLPWVYIQCEDSKKFQVFYWLYNWFLEMFFESVVGVQFYIPLVCHSMIRKEKDIISHLRESEDSLPLVSKTEYTGRTFEWQKSLHSSRNSKWTSQSSGELSQVESLGSNEQTRLKTVELTTEKVEGRECQFQKSNWNILRKFSRSPIASYTESFKHTLKSSSLQVEDQSICFNLSTDLRSLKMDQIGKFSNPNATLKSTLPHVITNVETLGSFNNTLGSKPSLIYSPSTSNISCSTAVQDASSIGHNSSNRSETYSFAKCKRQRIEENGTDDTYLKRPRCNDVALSERKDSDLCVGPFSRENVLSDCGKVPAVLFQNMANKSLKVSEIALQKAMKMFEDVCSEVDSHKCYKQNVKSSEKVLNDFGKVTGMAFQTAAGKSLKISESAMRNAMKMFEEVCSQVDNHKPLEKNVNSSETVSKEGEKLPNVSFQTAAGKSLKVSGSAMTNAMKMFEEVCSQVDLEKPFAMNGGCAEEHKTLQVRTNNVVEDNIFTNEFFEDVSFDDMEPAVAAPPLAQSLQSDALLKCGKKRKSLGGRRSLKPYSCKR